MEEFEGDLQKLLLGQPLPVTEVDERQDVKGNKELKDIYDFLLSWPIFNFKPCIESVINL